MGMANVKFGFGASARRVEDQAFLTGQGRYTDDIAPQGCLHGYVLRSPVAAGTFTMSADSLEAARTAPGVHLVLTGADTADLGDLTSPMYSVLPQLKEETPRNIPVLCRDTVRHVGDAVAFIVAESRAQAMDAAELIEVDYEPSAAVTETARALDADAPLVWPDAKNNHAFTYHRGSADEADAAFAKAAHVTKVAFVNNRLVCNYMEPRAAIGDWRDDGITLTTGSQGVFGMRRLLCQNVFRIEPERMRVITPDVGGGFGPKTFVYREYPLVLEASRRLGRPVKWTGDRTEHFLQDAQGRDNVVEAEMAMDAEGRFLALRINLIAAMGAYANQFGPFIPWVGTSMTTGVYDIPVIDVTVECVYTNTVPVDAYRGAGRPEAALLIEKLADQCARDMNMTPDALRAANFIRPGQFPYTTATGRMYDVGEFEGHMRAAMEKADWNGFESRAAEARERGLIRGIGMATYIEACAFAGSEPAHLKLEDSGDVTLFIGTQSNGQGHATAYAQFVADKLNLPLERIHVRQGDTNELANGGGTGGSRSIPLGGVSASRAGEDLAEKLRRIAASELEADAADIELEDGLARIVGTDRSISFAAIAKAAKDPEDLKGFGEFKQDEATYPNGTHVCEVEIDPQTGATEIVRYTIVDDFGATVNPMLLAGQVHGGAVQGIGQALMENTVYDDSGQLITATFMDYAMPRASDMPAFDFETRNVPSTTNAMGIKGAGEAGTIGATPAALNAVTDALWRACGVSHIEMPATPERIWRAIDQAGGVK
ncbi:MAG: xanthine dehydrogenase family protein molybdopterin-binding subunit [Brucellaceae bacterium]|nr:xanthine dehydrogenase family protein molybdopterin-binding subunit [Brucellaceae bacterium]